MINREYDKKLKATKEKVVLRKFEKEHERIEGGIYIPTSSQRCCNASKAKIESLHKDTKTGLKEKDIVLYDHYSVYYDHHPVVVLKDVNILCKVEEDETITPLSNHILLTEVMEEQKVGEVIVPGSVERVDKRWILERFGLTCDKGELEIGDKLLLNATANEKFANTIFRYQGKKYNIIHRDFVVAKVD